MRDEDQARTRRDELVQILTTHRQEAEARYRQALAEQLSGSAAGDSEGVHGWKASREGGAEGGVLHTLDRTVRQIDTALASMQPGRSGHSGSTDGPIRQARLRAV